MSDGFIRRKMRFAEIAKRDVPPRFKPQDEWSVDESLEHSRTGAQPESDEYLAYLDDIHEAAGIEGSGRSDAEGPTTQTVFDQISDPNRSR